jgi:hypothetical protein
MGSRPGERAGHIGRRKWDVAAVIPNQRQVHSEARTPEGESSNLGGPAGRHCMASSHLSRRSTSSMHHAIDTDPGFTASSQPTGLLLCHQIQY